MRCPSEKPENPRQKHWTRRPCARKSCPRPPAVMVTIHQLFSATLGVQASMSQPREASTALPNSLMVLIMRTLSPSRCPCCSSQSATLPSISSSPLSFSKLALRTSGGFGVQGAVLAYAIDPQINGLAGGSSKLHILMHHATNYRLLLWTISAGAALQCS